MATAALPLRMAPSRVGVKSPPVPATSSSRAAEASTSESKSTETSGKPFRKIRSSLEQTLRTATRSRSKPAVPPSDDFSTVKVKQDKGKAKALGEQQEQERVKESKDKERSRKLSIFAVNARSGRESAAPSPIPPPIIGKTKDGGGGRNVKIQEGERVRAGGLTSFITPSLRQASMSSPALHLSSQAIPSPKSQSAVPVSSSSTSSALVSPTRDRTRRSSLQASSKDISGPMSLASRRDGRSNGNANEPQTPRRPPPLSSPSSPSILTSSRAASPSTPTRRIQGRPLTPDTPTPPSSRSQHKKAAASTSAIPHNTRASSPSPRTDSPIRAKSPSTRGRVVSPSQRGLTSISTSNLPLSTSTPSPTPRRPSFEAQRRPSIDVPRRSVDTQRGPSTDAPRRPSIDAQRRPSIDSPRRTSGEHQRRPSITGANRPISPSDQARPRATSPGQRANSPLYSQNRHFNVSTASLLPSATAEQRELLRSATSILCKEMRKPPPHLSGSTSGLKEWELVEMKLQPLARLERIWGKSGGTLGGSSSHINAQGGSNGLTSSGEDRERRYFSEALRDGFVLCQLMNKLRPGTIARVDPRDDGRTRTSNVTRFLASCSQQGVPADELFLRDDLLESNPETLARVARTIICVVKVVESPVVDRSKVLSGQGKKLGGSDTRSGPYGYGTSSRAASSVPNLSLAQLQRSASPTSPVSPTGRAKRWSPPSPGLAPVRSASPSERGSGTGSSKTAQSTHTQRDRTALTDDHSHDANPPAITPRSPLRPQGRPVDEGTARSRSPFPVSEQITRTESTSPSTGDHSIAESIARHSMVSTATDTTAYSSLLDRRNSNGPYNKYGTIRTITTEATSDMPSYTRTEANSVAATISEELARKRGKEPGRRERRPSEAAIVDLSRVAEERPEDVASRPGSKAGTMVAKQESPERLHLGKGKWPEDFTDIFQGPNRSRPIPIKTQRSHEGSPSRHSPISVSPPRKLAYVGSSRISEGLEPPSPQSPRRPTHRSRHSVETAGLAPRDPILRRDISPDGISSVGPKVMLRRASTKSAVQRNGSYLPRGTLDDPRTSKEDIDGPVAFPRSVSGDASPAASSDGPTGADIPGNEKPRLPRGRFQSEIEGMSASRRARPTSYDELGQRPHRARFESMVNLGVASSNASASDILSRDSLDGSLVRKTLVVREEGKPPTRFQLGNCIGRGQFGSVYRALNLNTGQMVAVKQIRLEGLKEDEVTQLMREVDLVKSLSHPSIVKYEGMARDHDTLSIVLEYVENGSLGQTLKAFGKLNEGLVASYVVKILEGLHYLHESDVVHCDLKAANILTTKNGNVKLSDFGVSLNLRTVEREMKDVAGTPNWMAPEVIELKGASTKADIWSLGCTVIELLTGRPPYAEIANGMSVMFRIVEDDMPPIPEGSSAALQDFLQQCFNKDPTLRPSAEILCEHEWLNKSLSALKDLRPQDSIPFLRRVSTDFQKSEALHFLSQIDMPVAESPFDDENSRSDNVISGTPPSPIKRRFSNSPASPLAPAEESMSPRDHSFVKTTFSKPMVCRVCLENVKKSAVLCETCSLIAHSKCAVNAPPTCDLRAQLLLYAQYAEKGNPTSAYATSMDVLKGTRGHIPTSPTSEVAYVAPSPSSKKSVDFPLSQSPPPHASSHRPPTAFKFMGFKTKRSRANLTPEPGIGSSSTSLLQGGSDIHSQGDIQELSEKTLPKVVTRKPSVLRRSREPKQRPQSLSSNSTSPNTASMRSAAESLSSRLETQRKSALTASDTDGATKSRLPPTGELGAGGRPSHMTTLSGASTVAAGDDDPSIPGSMPEEPRSRKRDSKKESCSIQ